MKDFLAERRLGSLPKRLLGFFASEWICIIFFFVSFARLSFSLPTTFPISPLDDLFFVPLAILIIKFFRDRKPWMWGMISVLMISFYHNSTRKILLPALLILMILGLFRSRRVGLFLSHVRIALPMSIMTMLYPFVPILIQAVHRPDQDARLQRIDEMIFGMNPQTVMEQWMNPLLSEWMALSYSAYGFIILFVFVFLFMKDDLRGFYEYVWMSTLCLAVGYTLYSFVPAQGPVFTQQFGVDLNLYYMKYVKEALMDRTRIERDCFPSLHTALSLICLYSAGRHVKRLFWPMLPLVLTVPVACVYLRYHYVIDVMAGTVLAALIVSMAHYRKLKESNT